MRHTKGCKGCGWLTDEMEALLEALEEGLTTDEARAVLILACRGERNAA